MKTGDRVMLIGIPSNVEDRDEMRTRTLFKKCLGQSFTVDGMETLEGLPQQLARLNVGHVLGEPAHSHTIWVEEEFLRLLK